jgi:hypothetical protein
MTAQERREGHTEACYAQPTCTTCGRKKAPRGRLASDMMNVCGEWCDGYRSEPLPGHLWPSERPRLRDEGSVREDGFFSPLER